MLTKETIAYLLEELQSRSEVLDDLLLNTTDFAMRFQVAEWCNEQVALAKAVKELKQC